MHPKISTSLIEAVRLYIVAQAIAQVKREQMDKIYDELLEQIPLFNDRHPRIADGKRITKNKDMYLSKDDDACMAIYQRAHLLAVERKIKPTDMPELHCPALVAEHLQAQAENHMLDEVGTVLGQGESFHENVTYPKREKFVRLSVQMVLAYVAEHRIPFDPGAMFKKGKS